MSCPRCHGFLIIEAVDLDRQLTVLYDRCVNCGAYTERGYIPVPRPQTEQGRPRRVRPSASEDNP